MEYTKKMRGIFVTIIALASFLTIFFNAHRAEAANPYVQNVFFGQDPQGDYISFDWVGVPEQTDSCTRDIVAVWLNRFNPDGTTEGIHVSQGPYAGDFTSVNNGGGSYSNFGNYAFASGFTKYDFCGTSDPDLSKQLPQHIKTYINPKLSPERLSFIDQDFITIQIIRLHLNVVNVFGELLASDPQPYYYQVPTNPIPVIPYTNVKFGFDKNDLLKISFDWVGPSRDVGLLAGFNGNISYPFYAHFVPDPSKDISIVLEDGHNENFGNVEWLGGPSNVQKGQHYEIFVNELHEWSPVNTLKVCNWYYPCPVSRSLTESLLGRSLKTDDYITLAFYSTNPSQPSPTSYVLNDPNKYYFGAPNNPPTLSYSQSLGYAPDTESPGVDPNKGTASSTPFSFKIIYTDADNNPPSDITLVVDDGSAPTRRSMTLDTTAPDTLRDGNYINGDQYTLSTILPKGEYHYHFDASDGKGGVARIPATGELNFAVINVPVIIMPGIVGSSLITQQDIVSLRTTTAVSGDHLWIPDSSSPLVNLGRIRALQMDNAGNSYYTIGVGDIIDSHEQDHFYDGLISDLVTHGYATSTDLTDLFLFPYDWRKDVLLTAQSLASKIDEIKSFTGSPIVDIIAHSQGGLVVKAYASTRGGNTSIRKFIDIGTPHLGTPFAFKTLMWGDDFDVKFTWLQELLGGKKALSQAVKDAAQNMPSMYELSPSNRYLVSDTTSPYYKDYNYYVFNPFYAIGSGALDYSQSMDFLISSGRNSNAKKWNQSLHQLTDDWSGKNYGIQQTVNFIGCGSATPGKIFIFSGKNGTPEYGIVDINGDTRVPLRSAENLNSDTKYYIPNGVHSSLPSTGSVPETIASILQDQPTLTSDLPTSSMDKACSFSGTAVSYHSPIDLHIYDSQGRHTGPTLTGGFENNIPGVTYDYIEDNKFAFLPDGNTYTVTGNATNLGAFDARVTTYQNSEPTQEYYYNEVPLATGSTTVQFSVAPNQTDHTLLVDPMGNGSFSLHFQPSSVLNASQIEDAVPPATIAGTSGILGLHSWYISNASVALTATDNNAGVLRTMYSIDGGVSWTQYTSPISVTTEGSTTIQYYSIDKAGNYESPKSVGVKIDKTPPEARISFDPNTKQLKVEGVDNLSAVSAVKNGLEYTLTDEAGHTLNLNFSTLKSDGGEIKARVQGLIYDRISKGSLPANMIAYEWSNQKDTSIKELEESITITGQSKVRAHYNSTKNETQIFLADADKPKDALSGLVMLVLNTHTGALNAGY